MADFYLTTMRTEIQAQFQYRAGDVHVPPRDGGRAGHLPRRLVDDRGSVRAARSAGSPRATSPRTTSSGRSCGTMNIVFTPYGWEWRIREGELSGQLLRPLHPHPLRHRAVRRREDPVAPLYLPIAVVPDAGLRPDVRPAARRGRRVRGRDLGRIPHPHVQPGRRSGWSASGRRASARSSRCTSSVELLLSGRLVPLPLMPDWVQTIAWFLPFRWTFYFPIETLVGDLTNAELLAGLGMQLFWILVGIGDLLARLALRDSPLHGGGELSERRSASRCSSSRRRDERAAVPRELRARSPPVAARARDRARRPPLVFSHTDGAERLDAVRAPLRCSASRSVMGGRDPAVDPAEHDAAHRGGAGGEARLTR